MCFRGTFVEPFSFLLEDFPQLKETHAGQYHNYDMNTAGECLLDIAVSTPLILTTGRGEGDDGHFLRLQCCIYTKCNSDRTHCYVSRLIFMLPGNTGPPSR